MLQHFKLTFKRPFKTCCYEWNNTKHLIKPKLCMLINYPIPGCAHMSITESTDYCLLSEAVCVVLTAKKKKRKQIRKQQKKLFFQLMATENYNKRLMVYAQIKQLNRELVKVLHVCACVPLVPRRKSKTKP